MRRKAASASLLSVLPLTLLLSSAAVAGEFYTYKTAHYIIETDISPEFSVRIGELMEILHAGYSKIFGKMRPRLKGLSVVRIRKRKEDYLKKDGGLPNSGGFYSSYHRMLCSYLEKQESYLIHNVLPHEGFHQFFDKYIGAGATWVNEGLAQFFEHSLIDGTEIKFGLVKKRDLDYIKKVLDSDERLSLRQLLTITNSEWSQNLMKDPSGKGKRQYAEARFLVHFLVMAKDGAYQKYLNAYLVLLKKGVTGERALIAAFGRNFKAIDDAWREYIRDMKPTVPVSCTANLTYLAHLLKIYHEAGEKIDSIEQLYEAAMAKKLTGWEMLPLSYDEEQKVTADDIETIKKWFVCPSRVKSGRKKPPKGEPEISYTFERLYPDEQLPSIVCRNHGTKLMIVAHFELNDKGKITPVVENIRYRKPRSRRK